LPDLVRAFQEGTTAIVRNPRSVRPWQHVLDCLSGYVSLAEGLLSGVATPGIFNFGPDPKLTLTVGEVADIAVLGLGGRAGWRSGKGQHPQETLFLTLDSSKSQSVLGWSQRVTAREAIHWTTEWSVRVFDGESALELTMSQISKWKGRSSTHELRN
jgi:CDP-glucose 4,6-dehydratase